RLALAGRAGAGNVSTRPSISAATSACTTAPSLATLTFVSPTSSTISGQVPWEASSPVAVYRIDFIIDGAASSWTEYSGPYMYNGDPDGRLDTTKLSNGTHTLTLNGYDSTGTKIATASKTLTVSNTAAPATTTAATTTTTTPPPPPPSTTTSTTTPAPPPPPPSSPSAGDFVSYSCAHQWFVDPSISSSGNGTSWATAWKAPSNIVWSSVKP